MCHWTIEAPRGYKIRLELSAFNLEADSTCRFDYLLIYDGSSVGSREIGRFCGPDGSSRIGPVESTSNVMTVIFNSDSSLTNSGFQAYWYANNGQGLTPPATTTTPFTPHRGGELLKFISRICLDDHKKQWFEIEASFDSLIMKACQLENIIS